ncbi:winged helix-turn-helix domain-containing protein [Nitrosopumilus ureiphilus]
MDPLIIQNIMKLIYENRSIRKTPLMEKANMNYLRLNAYLKWLELIDFIKIDESNIFLTESGSKFIFRCLK